MRDPYEVLGVGPRASRQDVRAAYRRQARVWHPDRHATAPVHVREDAELRMKELNAAYDAVSSGRAAAMVSPARRAGEAWETFATVVQEHARTEGGKLYSYVQGPTLRESLRDIRDVLLGRETPPFTIDEVARRLRVHPKTVYRMLERGVLRGQRIGGLWRVTGEQFANYLFGRRPS